MRLLIIILTIAADIAYGQSSKSTKHCEKVIDTLTNREIYNTVDIQAHIIGGLDNLYSELGTIKLPTNPETDRINIYISFIVEPNGDIVELKAIGTIKSTTLDNELLELFRRYKWEPGKCNGTKVPSRLILRVVS